MVYVKNYDTDGIFTALIDTLQKKYIYTYLMDEILLKAIMIDISSEVMSLMLTLINILGVELLHLTLLLLMVDLIE
jgi:hypothetical protein